MDCLVAGVILLIAIGVGVGSEYQRATGLGPKSAAAVGSASNSTGVVHKTDRNGPSSFVKNALTLQVHNSLEALFKDQVSRLVTRRSTVTLPIAASTLQTPMSTPSTLTPTASRLPALCLGKGVRNPLWKQTTLKFKRQRVPRETASALPLLVVSPTGYRVAYIG
ncbi:hypothetical protein B0H13DRAFT_2264325 [Mycena leptocephala]|nr:hypothetical protein B0H13DRAFT_2264325 [Mycena leptocephala]